MWYFSKFPNELKNSHFLRCPDCVQRYPKSAWYTEIEVFIRKQTTVTGNEGEEKLFLAFRWKAKNCLANNEISYPLCNITISQFWTRSCSFQYFFIALFFQALFCDRLRPRWWLDVSHATAAAVAGGSRKILLSRNIPGSQLFTRKRWVLPVIIKHLYLSHKQLELWKLDLKPIPLPTAPSWHLQDNQEIRLYFQYNNHILGREI